jgi:hypothetical protein
MTLTEPIMQREFKDAEGRGWTALAEPHRVAHMRAGSRLAFRAADDPQSASIPSPISFNSIEAGEFAVRTMSEKELMRRLAMALSTARVDEHSRPPTD